MAKVSIIIPVYNGEKYLAQAIESALVQSYTDREIIVVNDGSTDNTAKIMAKFGHNIKSIHHANQGLGASRNVGIDYSSGEFLAFLDHDDLWVKDKLELQMQYMLEHEREDPLIFACVKQFICESLTELEKSMLLVNESVMPGYIAGTLLISKKRFAQVGYFTKENKIGEFIEWYLAALDKKVPIKLLNLLTLHRRVHATNMGRQESSKRGSYLKILKNSLDRRRSGVLENNP